MKTIDEDIRGCFKEYNPDISDSKVFMDRLNQKLDSVEDVRAHNKAAIREYWTVSIIAFGAGAAIGIFIMLVILLRPASLTEFRLLVEGVILRFFAFWRELLAIGIVVSMILIIIPLVRSYRYFCLRGKD